jgi:hypothetical protein
VDSFELRARIYRMFAEAGRAPTTAEIESWVGDRDAAADALARLHDAHAIVLDSDLTSIRMAMPFSAIPTDHVVAAGGRRWWANCAWDALGIPAALHRDASIEARWMDTQEPVALAIVDGQLSHEDGFVHFGVPARSWWDDIVET